MSRGVRMTDVAGRLAPCLMLAAALAALVSTGAQAGEAAPAAAPAVAVAPPAAPSESEVVARRIIRGGLADLAALKPVFDQGLHKADAKVKAEAAQKGGPGQMAYGRLGYWAPLFGDAAWEELSNDGPAFERILGPYMVKHFTAAELHAVSAFLDDPAFADILANATATGDSQAAREAKMKPAGRALLRRFRHSAAGRRFMAKFDALDKDPDFEPTMLELVAAVVPGVARRWGEKAEAAEATRAASADAVPPQAPTEADPVARHIVAVSVAGVSEMKPIMDAGFDKGEAALKATMTKYGPPAQMAWDRLGYWSKLLEDASFEEFAADGPKFERILAPYLVKHFTSEELHAVSALLGDAAFSDLRAFLIARTASPYASATMSPAAQAALDRFSKSAGGKSFMAKARTLVAQPDLEPVGLDLVAAWAPGTMRRWGEKVAAAEAARAAAQPATAN